MIHNITTAAGAGAALNMLSIFDSIQVRNEEKLSQYDRDFCERQQLNINATLQQLDTWYEMLCKEAEPFKEIYKAKFGANGKVDYTNPYLYQSSSRQDYKEYEFTPFETINTLVEQRRKAIQRFGSTIIGYFNQTYSLSIDVPYIEKDKMPIDYHPVYTSYIDQVIGSLGGKSFRQKAEEEITERLLSQYPPQGWKKPPLLKNKTIIFEHLITFDSFDIEHYNRYQLNYNERGLYVLCAALTLFADGRLNGGTEIIQDFKNDNIVLSDWYKLRTLKGIKLKFYKRNRVDVRFENKEDAEACFNKLRLNEL